MILTETSIEQFVETLPWISPDMDIVDDLQSRLYFAAQAIGAGEIQLNPPTRVLSQGLSNEQNIQLNRLVAEQPRGISRADQLDLNSFQIPIVESGERMVSLEERSQQEGIVMHFSERPFSAKAVDGWANQRRVFSVRENVANQMMRIGKAANIMGLTVRIEDAFRPFGVLQGVLRDRVFNTARAYPDMPFDEFKREVAAKTALYLQVAGHSYGSAVDFTLLNSDGTPLDLGNTYPQGGAVVEIDSPFVSMEQWATRRTFEALCVMTGGTVYPEEDWHVSWGDPLAGSVLPDEVRTNFVACYGPVRGFNPVTGEIESFENMNPLAQIISDSEIRLIIKEALNGTN